MACVKFRVGDEVRLSKKAGLNSRVQVGKRRLVVREILGKGSNGRFIYSVNFQNTGEYYGECYGNEMEHVTPDWVGTKNCAKFQNSDSVRLIGTLVETL